MQFVKLRAGHAYSDRSPALVSGDEPDNYRPFAEVSACGDKAKTNAYADLFAAAPELLEALELCERALEERDPEAEEYAAKKARAAIAKARGAA